MLRENLTFVVKCDHPGCQAEVVLPRIAANFLRHDQFEPFVEEVTGEKWQVEVPPRTSPVDLVFGVGLCKCPAHKNKNHT